MRITDKFALALPLVGLSGARLKWKPRDAIRVGTSAASQLLIPVGARDMALGGSSAAASTGIEALHWNPAGLASSTSAATILAQTTSYLADMQLNYAAVGANLGSFGHLAVSMKALSVGDIAVTTTSAPDGTGGKHFRRRFSSWERPMLTA